MKRFFGVVAACFLVSAVFVIIPQVTAHAAPTDTVSNATSFFGPGVSTDPTTGGTTYYVSWIGMDGHINVHQAPDAEGKCSLPGCLGDATVSDTGLDTPAIQVLNGNMYVAWAGTENPVAIIHVARYDGSSTLKDGVIPHSGGRSETTTSAPSLLNMNNLLYLAWRGGDNHINIATSPDGKTWLSKVTLSDTTSTGPVLAGFQGHVYVAWPGTDTSHTINLGYFDGSSTLQNKHVYSGQTTFDHLGFAANNTFLYLAWAGSDPSQHLNVARFDGSGFGGKYTRSDTTIAGPSLVWAGPTGSTSLHIDWTGTDPSHTVNASKTTES